MTSNFLAIRLTLRVAAGAGGMGGHRVRTSAGQCGHVCLPCAQTRVFTAPHRAGHRPAARRAGRRGPVPPRTSTSAVRSRLQPRREVVSCPSTGSSPPAAKPDAVSQARRLSVAASWAVCFLLPIPLLGLSVLTDLCCSLHIKD